MPIYIDAEVHNDENKGMLVILEVYIGESLGNLNTCLKTKKYVLNYVLLDFITRSLTCILES